MATKNDRQNPGGGESERALLEFLTRPSYSPLPQRELIHKMHLAPKERPEMRRLIDRLLGEGRMVKLSRGRLAVAPTSDKSDTVEGTLHRHRDGYGFVVPGGGGEDVFVAPRHLGRGQTGDHVVATITKRGRGGRLQGEIVRTVRRKHRTVLGVFVAGRAGGGGGQVQPFDPSMGEPIQVPASSKAGARTGQVVTVEPRTGKILELLGHIDEPGTDTMAVTRKYGLLPDFPAAALAGAQELPSRVGPAEKRGRERFDDPAPVTIDGETAKDFDDAIAVATRPGGGFRLFVHIADVAHFVAHGDALDLEARRRGTSVYFPDRVIPMFPEKLSNDLCSLRPGVDRLVQSVVLDIDARGKTTSVRFADGVIRSAARLTYTQVAKILDGESASKGVPPRLVPMLQAADKLRRALEKRRAARGSIDFDLPEPQLLLDVEGVMTGITIEPRNRAHRLIEECMLATNEAVAGFLDGRGWPCMFRVHEQPDPFKLEQLGQFVRTFGLELADSPGPADLRNLLGKAEGRPEYRVISQVVLRSMKQARYTMDNSGHFSLAAPTYAHFTSPIRRYPDLVVHRLLRDCRARRASDDVERLDGVAQSASELERNAEAAERELLAWKKIAFIAGHVGEVFAGVVTGVTKFGLFVQLTENLAEGLIHVERLGEEYFEFDESRLHLRGSRSGTTYRLGDRITVQVDRVDRVLRRVDFSPVSDKTERSSPRPPAPGHRPRRRGAPSRDGRRRARR